MIETFMQFMAPKGVASFFARFVLLTGFVAVANLGFSALIDDRYHSTAYYVGHALFVGGPLIAFFLAVTAFQIKLQRRLWRLSRKDGLTGLNNRRSFFESAERIRFEREQGILLVLDADRFKAINDTYGHQAGDSCLKSIAYTLKRGVRKDDIVGRIGGEEFAIFLRDTTPGQAKVIGERLTLPITFRTSDDIALTVTLSIGAAIATSADSLDDLFQRADRALYHAKEEGRARMIFASDVIAA